MKPEVFMGLPYYNRVKLRHSFGITNYESALKHDLDILMNVVCEYLELDKSKLTSKSRLGKYVEGRHYFCYLAREITDETLKKIGRIIGRDHATVLHSSRKVEDLLCYDKKTKADIKQITEIYKNR